MSTDAPSHTSNTVTAFSPPTTRRDVEQAVVLSSVSWETYLELRDNPENRGLRMSYADGELEIMTLSGFHELISHLIDHFIIEWCIARNIPIRPGGSMTLRRQPLERGLEGDQCYYVQSESQVRGLDLLASETVPMPDLAVEVVHTSAVIGKLPIYSHLGVPEIWHWRTETLILYQLLEGEYVEKTESIALPEFPLAQLRQALARRTQHDLTALFREFRQWLNK